MNNEENIKKIRVNHLLALCNTIDDYEKFQEDLINFSNGVFDLKSYYKLTKLSNNMRVFGSNKVKKFYYDNRCVIDKINSYTDLYRFLYINYEDVGYLREDSNFLFFHNYILNNREDLDKILSVTSKMKELGLKDLKYLEDACFTDQIYTFYNTPVICDVDYLDNMVILPNYQNEVFKYKSTGSNYKITLGSVKSEIIVNSLLFDKNKLPDKLSKESILNKFYNLREGQKDNITSVRNSVDLSIGVYDLIKQFNSTKDTIEKLDKVESKSEMVEILSKIEKYIYQLNAVSDRYDEKIVNNSSITQEELEEEKKLYLKRRFYNSIDFD